MLATDAMVVPSLKLLDWITELPTLMGTSRIIPVMVLRTSVVLATFEFLAIPSRIISKASCAFCASSFAFL